MFKKVQSRSLRPDPVTAHSYIVSLSVLDRLIMLGLPGRVILIYPAADRRAGRFR